MKHITYNPIQCCHNCAAPLPLTDNKPIVVCEFCGTNYIHSGPTRMLVKNSVIEQYGADALRKFMQHGGILAVDDPDDVYMMSPLLCEIPPEMHGLVIPNYLESTK